jgi:hypothetical protein
MREVYRDIVYGLTLVVASFTAYLAWRGPRAADPPAVQAAANHPIGGLIVVATLFLLAGVLNSAPLLLRLLSRNKVDAAAEDGDTVDSTEHDDTDYKELFLEESDARNKYQDKYTVAANKVLELQATLSQPQIPIKSDLERWCEALAHNDTSNMQQRVIAVIWEPHRVDERSNHYIEFRITFVNASIFELKSPRLGGIAKFDRHPLPFIPQFGQPYPLARGQKTWMSIRQPLTKEIAEDIQARLNRDGVAVDLDFSELEITFDVEFPGRTTWQWTWKGRDSVSVKAITTF